MHLIVLTEAAQGQPLALRASPPDRQALITRWNPLMLRLVPGWNLSEDPDALNTLAERALAQLVPGGASIASPSARLTPFHGLVGSDRITLVPPAELQLDEAESKALFASVEPLLASEGVALAWHSPLHWQIEHDSLRNLPCASLARAEGDSVQRWQGRTPLAAARLIRRLQNEAQMVLHDHPVNQQRAQRGALTVNSLWLDRPVETEGVQIRALLDADEALQHWVDTALAAPAEQQGTAADPTLVICGRHSAQAFTMRRVPGGWRGAIARTLIRPPPTRPLAQWLEQLDTEPGETPA